MKMVYERRLIPRRYTLSPWMTLLFKIWIHDLPVFAIHPKMMLFVLFFVMVKWVFNEADETCERRKRQTDEHLLSCTV